MENNELIAEFMGNKPYNDSRYGIMWPDPTNGNKVGFGLHYDKKWSWIMLVVEKVGRMQYLAIENDDTELKEKCAEVLDLTDWWIFNDVYNSLFKFIKWYISERREVV